MKIKINSNTVTIVGQNGFDGLDMSGNYCPSYTNADCTTPGKIIFTMSSDGSVN